MSRTIFISLPVTDLDRSKAFYAALGFTHEPRFSDDTAACMVVSETIHVTLLTHARWMGFTTRPIAPQGSNEVGFSLGCESKDEVNRIVEAAGALGGVVDINPPEDHGFMFQRSVADPDGHIWEPMWMDPAVASGEAPMPEAHTA